MTLSLIGVEKPVFPGRTFNKSVLFGQFYNTFTVLNRPQYSGRVKYTNGNVRNQLAKFIQTIQIPWPEALPLVLLNLRPTAFGTQTLNFWDSYRVSNALAPASFDLQRVKGECLHFPLTGPYQVMLTNSYVTKLQRLGPQICMTQAKKAPNPDWMCRPYGELKKKISWNWSRWHLIRAIPRYSDQVC